MRRDEVVQRLLDLFRKPAYLEIGVDSGATFHRVRAARKVAVDPAFRFDVAAARADRANARCRYVGETSDQFFSTLPPQGERFHLVYIDGLHTFEQALRDLLNAMVSLTPRGLLLIDDVLPSSYAASLPDMARAGEVLTLDGVPNRDWMGDVYRLLFFVRDHMPGWSYATVAENHGQMVMWRAPRMPVAAPRSIEAIARLDYAATLMERDAFNILPFDDIERQLRAWRNDRTYFGRGNVLKPRAWFKAPSRSGRS